MCNEEKIINLLLAQTWNVYADNIDSEDACGYLFPDGTAGIAFQSEWDYYQVSAIGWFDFEMSMATYSGKDKPIVWKIASIFFANIMESPGSKTFYTEYIDKKAKEEVQFSELTSKEIMEKYLPLKEAYSRVTIDIIKNRIRKMFIKYQKVVIPDSKTVKSKKLKSLIKSYLWWMECCWAERSAYMSINDMNVNNYIPDPCMLEYTLSIKDIVGVKINEFIEDEDGEYFEESQIIFPIYRVLDQFNNEHEMNAALPFTSISILMQNLRKYEKKQIINNNDIFRIERFIEQHPL